MDRFSFLGTSHIGFLDDLYQQYVKNPDEVEPSWRAFFQGYDFSRSEYGDLLAPEVIVPDEVRKEFAVLDLINGYRTRGHLFTQTNPVRQRRSYSRLFRCRSMPIVGTALGVGLTTDNRETSRPRVEVR